MKACIACRDGSDLDLTFSMAFQPIVDLASRSVWGYEALVRGTAGEPAPQVLDRVTDANRYQFDQACRVRAIELAGRLFPRDGRERLSINFMPNAVYEPAACISKSLTAAKRVGFDPRRLMFEFTEDERIRDTSHVGRIIAEYRRQGFLTAIDDFGAGYAGLCLLADFQTDIVKLDMALVRGIDQSAARRAIVASMVGLAAALHIRIIAEGVETTAELDALRSGGITLFQGFLFARPGLEYLPTAAGI